MIENILMSAELEQKYWNEREEDINKYWGKGKVIEEILHLIKQPASQIRILELGCGEGHFLNSIIAKLNYVTAATGLDINATVIDSAKRLYPQIQFRLNDMTKIDSIFGNESFDIVIAINSFHEVYSKSTICKSDCRAKAEIVSLITKVYHLLSPNGFFVLMDGIEPANSKCKNITFKLESKSIPLYNNFINSYQHLLCKYNVSPNDGINTMTLHDFTKFITKLRFLNDSLWEIERFESYQYFTEEEFVQKINSIGFSIKKIEKFIADLGMWKRQIRIQNGNYPYEHIFIIGEKL